MKSWFVVTGALFLLSPLLLPALEFRQEGKKLIFTTPRMKAIVEDARIVHVATRDGKDVFASFATPERSRTSGLGNMLGQAKLMSHIHQVWGDPSINKYPYKKLKDTSCYRNPCKQTRLTVKKQGKTVIACWQGLSNGKKFFQKDSITLSFEKDAAGALAITAEGKSGENGVFGLQLPIENISGKGKFILPTMGGMEYASSGEPVFMGFRHGTLFYEAAVMTYVLKNASMGFWVENATFRPFYAMVGRNKNASSFGLEINTLIPFEMRDSITTPVYKLDVFQNADWIAAARPYRNWYHKTFAKDIAKRESIAWANRINTIIDGWIPGEKELKKIASFVDPEQVLFHIWQARKPGWDKELPDYTLRSGTAESIQRAHKHKFKVMCYVCALCANYRSPVWVRDKLETFFLTRKDSIANYKGGQEAFNEKLAGNIVAYDGKNQFAKARVGGLIYGDPSSPGWRKYYPKKIREMNEIGGLDANYQDTLGCTGDVGNGVVDGLSAGLSYTALTRALAKEMPNTPMASEYGPSPIAMGIKWPLNYVQVWGGRAFRRYRMHHQHPITPFLFGYRTWVPSIAVGDSFHRHLVAACSDALSGMGVFECNGKLATEAGFRDHLLYRSGIFTANALKPCYPERKYPKGVRAMYKDKNGGFWQYKDDGKLQVMLDPAGKAVYARIDGASTVKVPGLEIPNWPCRKGDLMFGLDPAREYVLFPVKKRQSGTNRFEINSLPKGAGLESFFAAKEFAYIQIGGKGNGVIDVKIPAAYKYIYINDQPLKGRKIAGKLPMRITFFTGKDSAPDEIRDNPNGSIEEAAPSPLSPRRRYFAPRAAFHFYSGAFHSAYKVKESDDAVDLYFQNFQSRYGNGSQLFLKINGKTVAKFDCRPKGKKWDIKQHCWTMPLKAYKGKHVLISAVVSNKSSSNADMLFVTKPAIVKTKLATFKETFPAPRKRAGEGKKPVFKRPNGKPLALLPAPNWKGKGISFGKGVTLYTPWTSHGVIMSSNVYSFEKEKKYFLSGQFRSAASQKGPFFLGICQMDKYGRIIQGVNVNAVPGTESILTGPRKKGDNKLMVLDASKWQEGMMISLGGKIPAESLAGPIAGISKYSSDWGVFLANPLKKDVPSDLPVRLHRSGHTHNYVGIGALGKEFAPRGGFVKRWPGAVKFRILILSKQVLEFKDLKLEAFADK